MAIGTQLPPLDGLTYVKSALASPPAGIKAAYVVELWATWCPPCRDTIPHLTKLQQQHSGRHVYFVGITGESDVAAVAAFVASQGSAMDYAVAVSARLYQELMTRAQAKGIPHAFVVDTTNTITYSGHPMDPQFETALRGAAALASPRAAAAQPRALPPVTDSYEVLMARPARELKQLLAERGIDARDCAEKGELVQRIVDRCASVTYYAQA